MKNYYYFFIIALFCSNGYAQEQEYDEPEVSIDSLLVNIDKSDFTSGILYERVFPWAQLDVFNDTVRISHVKYFEQALLELHKASIEEKFLSHKVLRKMYAHDSLQNVVDIGIINASFHIINYNEENEEEGALYFRDGLFEKIDNEEPAFLPRHVFVAAPLKQYLKGEEFIFRFSSDFLLEETEGKNIDRLIIDFGAPGEYILIEEGEIVNTEITVTYEEEGYKALSFTATFSDDTSLTTNGVVHVKAYSPPLLPGVVKDGNVEATIPFQGYGESVPYYGYIEYRTFHSTGNTEGILMKPIIIIDGFDPGDERKIQDHDSPKPDDEHTSIEEMMTYFSNSENKRKFLIEDLTNLGYDVIIVNHPTHQRAVNGNVKIDGGADYIERNARAHIALYQKLNNELTQNGSEEELVIVGPSMGGQISRYALAYMEANDMPHNTRLWVSVDSPHLGANIPMGVQTLLNVLNDKTNSVEAQDFVENQLGSAAAKQQLIEQYKKQYIGPFVSTQVSQEHMNGKTISQGYSEDRGHPYFMEYYDNLFQNGLSDSKGYPQNLRKIAIVNGALTNTRSFDNPFAHNSTASSVSPTPDFFPYHGAQSFKIEGSASIIGHIVTLETYFMPALGSNHKTAYFKKKKFLGWDYYNRFIDNNNSRGNMDNIPGGWFPSQWELAKSVESSSACDNIIFDNWNICANSWSIKTLEHVSSFIPTVSALGFNAPDFSWAQKFSKDLVCTGEVPFDSYYGPKKNERHTSFTEESVNWLLAELAGNPQPPTVYLDPEDMDGPTVICGSSAVTYSFNDCKSPLVVDWELSGNLQEVVPFGPAPDNSIKVTPTSPSVNGWAYVKAIFASPNAPVQKYIWIGPPKVESVETVSILNINHTMPISYPDGCDDIGLKLNIEPSFDNVQEIEWKKVTANYQWTQDPPGYDDEYTIIAPLCNDIVFKVRMQNGCGWSEWEEIEYNASNCGDCNPGGGSGGSTITTDYFKIWPNPADTVLHVTMIGSDPGDLLMAGETLNLKLFNLSGTLVYNFNAIAEQNHIDVSNLPAGPYVLHINYSEQSPNLQTVQIIVQ